MIPVEPLAELARHFNAGAKKYAAHQWRAGYEWHKSYDAIHRHLRAFWGGEDYDVCHADEEGCAPFPDATEPLPQGHTTCYNHTGSHHMACVAWHSFVLLEFKDTHPEFDDRYMSPHERGVRKAFEMVGKNLTFFEDFDLEANRFAFQDAVKNNKMPIVLPDERGEFVKAAAEQARADEQKPTCPAGGCINCNPR